MTENQDAKIPDHTFTITDDHTAIAVLTDLGLMGCFPATGRKGKHTAIVKDFGHRTHWIIAARFLGNPDPADNGFVIYGYAKAQTTQAEAEQALKEFQARHGDGTPPITATPGEPDAN